MYFPRRCRCIQLSAFGNRAGSESYANFQRVSLENAPDSFSLNPCTAMICLQIVGQAYLCQAHGRPCNVGRMAERRRGSQPE